MMTLVIATAEKEDKIKNGLPTHETDDGSKAVLCNRGTKAIVKY